MHTFSFIIIQFSSIIKQFSSIIMCTTYHLYNLFWTDEHRTIVSFRFANYTDEVRSTHEKVKFSKAYDKMVMSSDSTIITNYPHL